MGLSLGLLLCSADILPRSCAVGPAPAPILQVVKLRPGAGRSSGSLRSRLQAGFTWEVAAGSGRGEEAAKAQQLSCQLPTRLRFTVSPCAGPRVRATRPAREGPGAGRGGAGWCGGWGWAGTRWPPAGSTGPAPGHLASERSRAEM